jgi:hypothetical protein
VLPGPERALPAGADPVVGEAPPALPGVTDLGAILGTGWRPSASSILLGLGPGGTPITVSMGDHLCHVVFAGRTGSGKSNLMRLVLAQLCAAGAQVYLLDPHFTPLNPQTGDDWRAIARRLVGGRAITDKREIVATVAGICQEIDARLTRWHAGQDPGPARFYAIEELPLLVDYDKDFMTYLGRVLREGRKLGLYLIVAAQDLLVSTINSTSGLRSQFATVYYGGGDPYTAKAILAQRVAEPPGKGVAWMRSVLQIEPQQVRVPLVTNDNLATLLATNPANIVDVTATTVANRPAAPVAADKPEVADVAVSEDAQRALELFLGGLSLADIVKTMRGVSSQQGGTYQKNLGEIQDLLRQAFAAR